MRDAFRLNQPVVQQWARVREMPPIVQGCRVENAQRISCETALSPPSHQRAQISSDPEATEIRCEISVEISIQRKRAFARVGLTTLRLNSQHAGQVYFHWRN